MYWYALFVRTGFECEIVKEIENIWQIVDTKPFIPTYDAKFRKSGIDISEKRKLFPGYVFIESSKAGSEFWNVAQNYVYSSRNALKILSYGAAYDNGRSIEMSISEQKILRELFDENHCIKMSQGLLEGDRVRIVHGPLMNHESLIKKIRWRKREAIIEIELMGSVRELSVGLEVVAKI